MFKMRRAVGRCPRHMLRYTVAAKPEEKRIAVMNRVRMLTRLMPMLLMLWLLSSPSITQAQVIQRIGVIGEANSSLVLGARLAAEHLNAAGDLRGADGNAYRLQVVDTSPGNMDIAIANMRQARAIAVLGPDSPELVERYLSQLQSLNVPVLTTATDAALLRGDDSRRIFRSRASETVQWAALADYLVASSGARSVNFIQLDAESLGNLAIIAQAFAERGLRLSNTFYDARRSDLGATARSIVRLSSDAVAISGPPTLAGQVVGRLVAEGFRGDIVYQRADEADFLAALPDRAGVSVIMAESWSIAQQSQLNRDFVLAYAQAYRQLPNANSAAAYDSVLLVARAFGRRGNLALHIGAILGEAGVQGELSPALLPPGETSGNVVITRLAANGQLQVAALYPNGRQIRESQPARAFRATATPVPTQTPVASPTPTGYHLIIQSRYQNVRSGPGTDYAVIGQAVQGAQLRVIGRSQDSRWLVVDYRGQYGWVAAWIVETFGTHNLVPIVQPPLTPTPIATSIPAPTSPAAAWEADIVIVSARPGRIAVDQPSLIDVTVMNRGATAAGNFSIASAFQPGDNYASASLNGLGAGESAQIQLQAQIHGEPGAQAVVIVADLNNQIWEGTAGEANNEDYVFHYYADSPVFHEASTTIAGHSVDLEGFGGGIVDISWSDRILRTLNNARLVWISDYDRYADIGFGDIDVARAFSQALPLEQALHKTFGVVTSEGRRGVLHFYELSPEGWARIRYRIYR